MKKLKLVSILALVYVLNVASMCSSDDDNSNDLNFDEFKKALRDFRISTEVKDAERLFKIFVF